MLSTYSKIVEEALSHYMLNVKTYSFMTEATNILYKVVTEDERKFVLKIFQEESSTLQDNLAELLLLSIIADKADIVIPKILKSRDGKGILQIPSEDKELKRVALYEWVAGDDFEGKETYNHFVTIGEIVARLHVATQGAVIPSTLKPKKWDKVFYYDNEVPIYKQEKYHDIVDEEYIQVMDKAIPLLNKQLKSFYQREEPQLIHGDLNPWNIRIHNDNIGLLDFEEAMLGFPIHDISIHLYYYRYDTKLNYFKVKEAFQRGYRKVLPLPDLRENVLEMFMTARRVNFLNYVLLIMDDPKEYIRINIPRVKDFLLKY